MNSLPGAMVGIGAAVVFDMVDAKELVSCAVVSGSEYMEGMISFSDYLKLIKSYKYIFLYCCHCISTTFYLSIV